jgi:hypothetical protein
MRTSDDDFYPFAGDDEAAPPIADGDNCCGDFRFHREFASLALAASSRRGSGAFYAPQDALQPRAEDRQRRRAHRSPKPLVQ